MKKTILIAIILVLTFVFSSMASATSGPPSVPLQLNSAGLQEPDEFYSPCTGNNVVNIIVNASAVSVLANFSAISENIDCGSGVGNTLTLSQSGEIWTGSCDLTAEAQGSNFDVAGPIIIVATNITAVAVDSSSLSAVLYNMTTPPGQNPACEIATTTNLCEELDFTQVNFMHEIEVNGSAGCNNGQAMPWGDSFQKVVTFNFSSLDFSSQDIGDKLARLGSALQVYVTPPGQTGDSYVYVNTTAFAELDSDTTVTIYGLPFAEEPAIVGESSALSSSYVLNAPYEIEITYDCDLVCDDECGDNETCYDSCFAECNSTCVDSGGNPLEGIGCYEFTQYVPNGDLTFAVSGFSQYNITDTVAPTITFNTPQEGDVLVGDESYVLNVNVTVDGTGTQLQSLTFVVDGNEPITFDYFDLLSSCTLENSEGTILTCQLVDISNMSRGTHAITVTAVDLGGSEGNSAEEEVSFLFDNVDCGATINESLALIRDLDCRGSSTDGLNPLEGVTIDCDGYSIIGGGLYKGINVRAQNNVTVKNCGITGFETGVYISSGNDNVIKENTIENNCEGIKLESSTALVQSNIIRNNNACVRTGLYVDGSSTAYVTNGDFIGNGEYGIYDIGPESVYWTITGAAKCINNSVSIANGNITFDGGTLELESCVLGLPDFTLDKTGTINSLDYESQSVTANTSTDFNFSESAISLTLSSDVTTTMTVTGETPGSAPTGFTALKGIDIIVDSTTEGAFVSALIKIYYSDAELTAANIAESSLKIYYYNETSAAWQLEPDQGVDTANNYVWVRVTHLSIYGIFGTAPSSPPSYSGGGGGGGSFYKKNQTTTTTTTNAALPCQDDWLCDVWSDCINGMKSRDCVLNDYPNCLTAAAKPATESTCTTPPAETPAPTPPETAPAPEPAPIADTVKQGLTGAATVAEQGISALTKQAGIGIAILVVIGGLAGYLLLFRR